MPIEEPLGAELVSLQLCLDFAHLDENPFQVLRPRLQNLLENIEIFGWVHPIDAEIEGVRRQTSGARCLIENRRGNSVIEMARPNEERVELVLVLGKML